MGNGITRVNFPKYFFRAISRQEASYYENRVNTNQHTTTYPTTYSDNNIGFATYVYSWLKTLTTYHGLDGIVLVVHSNNAIQHGGTKATSQRLKVGTDPLTSKPLCLIRNTKTWSETQNTIPHQEKCATLEAWDKRDGPKIFEIIDNRRLSIEAVKFKRFWHFAIAGEWTPDDTDASYVELTKNKINTYCSSQTHYSLPEYPDLTMLANITPQPNNNGNAAFYNTVLQQTQQNQSPLEQQFLKIKALHESSMLHKETTIQTDLATQPLNRSNQKPPELPLTQQT